jgi:S-ribosylhomocysteine lyase
MDKYQKIASFTKDHDVLPEGLHRSGTDAYGVTTYDLRFVKPNGGEYLSPAVMHTVEHCFATLARNGRYKDKVVYFGPMGCQTGFYLLIGIDDIDVVKQEIMSWCVDMLDMTEIPGSGRQECGNYLSHDLDGAKMAVGRYLEILRSI